MESKTKKVLKGSLIAGAVLGMSALSANANQLFSFNELGSGSEVRSTLLERATSGTANLLMELKCGDSTKTKDGKCGEGKCGDKKATGKSKDGKCGEGKCGEGKCGGKKATDKSKDDSKKK